MVDRGLRLTYGEWERRSDAAARGLVAHGARPADRIGLLFDNAGWTEYAVAYMAVLKAGATVVPLGPRFAAPELASILAHCGAVGSIAAPHLSPAPVPGWTASLADLEGGEEADPFQVPIAPGDLAEILYTSGTTGRPKGVALSHENVLTFDPPPGDTAGGRASFVHAFPLGTNAGQEVLRLPLRRGDRTAVVLPVFDPERFCALVVEHRVRRLQLVPAMVELLLSSGALRRHDLSGVERVVLSSAPASASLLERLAGALPSAEIWNTYALTEAGTARTLQVYDGSRPGSVGRGVGGTEVRVVDESDGHPLATGEVGEVWLRRPGAPPRYYYRDPEATAATFSGDWVRTGDLGHVDGEGYLYLVDRKSDHIVSGGLNISSLEVEGVLAEHPAVAEAAVFGVAHEVLGQDVAAAVVVREPVDERRLQAFVRGRLAEYKTPHRIVFVDRLPRNATGKVLKRELRDRFGGGVPAPPAVASATAPPASEGERAVAAIWEEVLSRPGIGPADDFFALGGHSLAAISVVARVNERFGIDLAPETVFEHPTVAELAAMVDDATTTGSPTGRRR